jgi:propanol-preferring alcohol dehydrogenase
MKAMRLFEQGSLHPGSLQLAELPLPEPDAGQVRLRVRSCGVCHTDLHTVEGDIHPPVLPLTPGHQVVGVVEENLCPNARFTGFHVNGGYAEAMIAPADYVLPLPESIPDEQAAPLLCAGIIGYRSLRQADIQSGERFGLVGFGASAHLAIQVARHWGCQVYVFTRSEEHKWHAEELGAIWVGEVGDQPPHPLDRAVIFAPAGKLVPPILDTLRPGGTLAINAIHMSPIPEMPYRLIYMERTLRSVANATYQDGVEFLELAAEIPVRATVELYPLEMANQALDDLKHSRINGEAVLVV